MESVFLTRHAQTFNNVVQSLLDKHSIKAFFVKCFQAAIAQECTTDLAEEEAFAQEGLIKYIRLVDLLNQHDLNFDGLFEQKKGIYDSKGDLIKLDEFTDDDYIPVNTVTGEGAEQAQHFGSYLGPKDVIFLTSNSLRTQQTAGFIAESMGITLKPEKNFYTSSDLVEVVPLEYRIGDLLKDGAPEDIKCEIGSLDYVDKLKIRLNQNQEEVRKDMLEKQKECPGIASLFAEGVSEEGELKLEPTLAEEGERLYGEVARFSNRYPKDIVAVLHGTGNVGILKYLGRKMFHNFHNCGLSVMVRIGTKLSLSEAYWTNEDLVDLPPDYNH